MSKVRDVIIFAAGAAFFHTISHILLPFFVDLPLNMGFMMFTPTGNVWTIVISAIITLALLWWASRIK